MRIKDLQTLKAMGFIDPNLMPDECFGVKLNRNRDIVRRLMRGEKAKDIAVIYDLSVSVCYDIARRAMRPYRYEFLKRMPKTDISHLDRPVRESRLVNGKVVED